MPLMIPETTLGRMRGFPFPPRYGFWAMALLTLIFAWSVRRDTNRGSLVLVVSLVLTTMLLFTLR
jgi:hypothetical protein